MRTIPISALAVSLLAPVLALAQPGMGPTDNQVVTQSPSFWFWLIAFAIAAVAFVVSNFIFGHRIGPHYRRRIS